MLGSNDAATQARQALELALRVGDVLLTAGMSANDVVVEMLRITEAYGLKRVHVDLTFTSIAVTYYAAPTTVPMTLVRTVQPDVLDFTKVRRVQALVEGIRGGRPLEDAINDLERIRDAPRLYSDWVASAGNACIAPGVTLLFTVSWQILVIPSSPALPWIDCWYGPARVGCRRSSPSSRLPRSSPWWPRA